MCFTMLNAVNTNWNGNDKDSGFGRSLPNECCQPPCDWSEACTRCPGIPNPVCVKKAYLKISKSIACQFATSGESSSSEEYCYNKRDCSRFENCIQGKCEIFKFWPGRNPQVFPPRPPATAPSPIKRCRNDWDCKWLYESERCINGRCIRLRCGS